MLIPAFPKPSPNIWNMNEIAFNNPSYIYTDYYSGVNVTLWCRGTWIDDVDSIVYVETSEAKPLFGYHSKHYAAVASGRHIVQGTFSVGYIANDYLQKIVLATPPDVKERRDIAFSLDERLAGDTQWHVANAETEQRYKELKSIRYEDPDYDYLKSQFNEAVRRRSLARSRVLYDIASQIGRSQNDVIMLNKVDPKESTVYQPIDLPLFDIRIHYADPVDMRASGLQKHREQSRRIVGVKIIRTEHRIDTSGEAIKDVHSFFAQRIDY